MFHIAYYYVPLFLPLSNPSSDSLQWELTSIWMAMFGMIDILLFFWYAYASSSLMITILKPVVAVPKPPMHRSPIQANEDIVLVHPHPHPNPNTNPNPNLNANTNPNTNSNSLVEKKAFYNPENEPHTSIEKTGLMDPLHRSTVEPADQVNRPQGYQPLNKYWNV